ncbi:aspartate--tRNA ligase [Candidatus Woesearchaeota archaeon CG_4_10_14_0_8_um_filter_47_5]|nr:MAG: aspartate--tRNA ligase [Candidatus Woesearchaeota archaeon CG_4_10_14_0_8_um_filter_47_5]
MLRTHTCGTLTQSDIGKKVTLAGWVQAYRDHGGVIFTDLRDRYGVTQLVFDPSHNSKVHALAEALRREYVITAAGTVRMRKEGMINPALPTGEVEVLIDTLSILNKSEVPPIEIDDRKPASEEMRLRYRYLDLRRQEMQERLHTRHKAFTASVAYLNSQEFIHIETPLLVKSTPEGARDYVVPSRVNPGKFYALPQSPQLYKQILMVAGFDRYFQLAHCLRDEDLRADRQPEHTQIDIEMSFVTREDVFELVEKLMKALWKEVLKTDIPTPFQKIPHHEALSCYGSDKPDLRFGLEIEDVTDIMKKSDFRIYKEAIVNGGIVKCLNVRGHADQFSRNEIDALIELAKRYHVQGLSWAKMTKGKFESSIVKYFSDDVQEALVARVRAKDNDLLLFVADSFSKACTALGQVRLHLGKKLGLIDEGAWKFAWIIDFPLFERNEEEDRWEPAHHMFCMPKEEHIPLLETDPGKVLANQYDLTLNGVELCSGSIRITDPEVQKKVMQVIGLSQQDIEERFGFLLEAFRYGAPPHGGVGLGFDRIVALMCKVPGNDIREVIAFPKNKAAQCPMDDSPSDISPVQLKELHIRSDIVKTERREESVYERICEILDKSAVSYKKIEHKPVYTSKEAAQVRNTKLKQGAKALLLKLYNIDNTDNKYLFFVTSAAYEIDTSKVKTLFKATEVRLATPDEVKEKTGCDIGSVPPFGNLFGLTVYVDVTLLENKEIAFNAGSHTQSIIMQTADFMKLTNAQQVDVSRK